MFPTQAKVSDFFLFLFSAFGSSLVAIWFGGKLKVIRKKIYDGIFSMLFLPFRCYKPFPTLVSG